MTYKPTITPSSIISWFNDKNVPLKLNSWHIKYGRNWMNLYIFSSSHDKNRHMRKTHPSAAIYKFITRNIVLIIINHHNYQWMFASITFLLNFSVATANTCETKFVFWKRKKNM